jgi:hypothetical protein
MTSHVTMNQNSLLDADYVDKWIACVSEQSVDRFGRDKWRRLMRWYRFVAPVSTFRVLETRPPASLGEETAPSVYRISGLDGVSFTISDNGVVSQVSDGLPGAAGLVLKRLNWPSARKIAGLVAMRRTPYESPMYSQDDADKHNLGELVKAITRYLLYVGRENIHRTRMPGYNPVQVAVA